MPLLTVDYASIAADGTFLSDNFIRTNSHIRIFRRHLHIAIVARAAFFETSAHATFSDRTTARRIFKSWDHVYFAQGCPWVSNGVVILVLVWCQYFSLDVPFRRKRLCWDLIILFSFVWEYGLMYLKYLKIMSVVFFCDRCWGCDTPFGHLHKCFIINRRLYRHEWIVTWANTTLFNTAMREWLWLGTWNDLLQDY